MSHGNITETVGTCDVCGREFVDLCRSNRGELMVCVDEFACAATWGRSRGTP